MSARTAEAIAQLATYFGVTATENQHGQLVVSASDFEKLRTLAFPPPLGSLGSVFGIRIVAVPDWMCNPIDLAYLRMIATWRRHRWYRRLERILTRWGK